MIADRKVGHALAEHLDDARRFVAERHRHGPRPRAVDHRQIGMAEARRRDSHQNLAAAGRREVEFDDFERPRLGVGRRKADGLRTAARMRMGFPCVVGCSRDASNPGAPLAIGEAALDGRPCAPLAPRAT